MANTRYPFNDGDMVYNYRSHRYTLTPSVVKEVLNIDLDAVLNSRGSADKSAVTAAFLNNISNVIYSFIYSNGVQNQAQEFLAAKHPTARVLIREAMLEQVAYEIMNGDISKLSGVDVRKGGIMDRRALRAARIAPVAVDILERPLDHITPCIVYSGTANMIPFRVKPLPAYEEEGY